MWKWENGDVQVFAVNVGAERPAGAGPNDFLTSCQRRAYREFALTQWLSFLEQAAPLLPTLLLGSGKKTKVFLLLCRVPFTTIGACAKNQNSHCLRNEAF